MATLSYNWYSGIVLTLTNSEVRAMVAGLTAIEQIVDSALSAAKIAGPTAWLIKPVVKVLFSARKAQIDWANRSQRGVYITFTYFLFARFVLSGPINFLPGWLAVAVMDPLCVFIGPR